MASIASETTELTLIQPDDWHIHLRDGAALQHTVTDAAKQFARAIVMPNLKPPVTDVALAESYYQNIQQNIPSGHAFEPLMTLYLTDNTSAATVQAAHASNIVHGFKLYPAGATTNSDAGLTQIDKAYSAIAEMEALQVPLLIHGEVTDSHIDIFDREKVFIETVLAPLLEKFPKLKVVLEHITTADAVEFVQNSKHNIAATITAHHLLINRNDMLAGGIRPHYYCLPIVKRQQHQQALLQAATSGNPKFFLGTDSAPHAIAAKETACGCAGVYTAHCAIELYAEAFESMHALDKLENFASVFGANFYGLPINQNKITLIKQPQTITEQMLLGEQTLKPFRAGETVSWQIKQEVSA